MISLREITSPVKLPNSTRGFFRPLSRRSMAVHPWHDLEIGAYGSLSLLCSLVGERKPWASRWCLFISFPFLSAGSEAPHILNCVVELTKGSKVKYELNKKTGLKVDRVLYSSVVYPHNYGFIPRTLCEDNVPINVLVLIQDEKDDKIILVCDDNPQYKHYNDIRQLPPHRLSEIRRFFEDYKKNENKQVAVDEFPSASTALEAFQHSMDLYAEYIMYTLMFILIFIEKGKLALAKSIHIDLESEKRPPGSRCNASSSLLRCVQ